VSGREERKKQATPPTTKEKGSHAPKESKGTKEGKGSKEITPVRETETVQSPSPAETSSLFQIVEEIVEEKAKSPEPIPIPKILPQSQEKKEVKIENQDFWSSLDSETNKNSTSSTFLGKLGLWSQFQEDAKHKKEKVSSSSGFVLRSQATNQINIQGKRVRGTTKPTQIGKRKAGAQKEAGSREDTSVSFTFPFLTKKQSSTNP